IFAAELDAADIEMHWSNRWEPRGTTSQGVIRQGLGVSMHVWPGIAHNFQCDLSINPDGSVAIRAGTQDIGTGTRTVMGVVAAETLGLPVDAVEVDIGDSTLPTSAASGGSGTVGGASAAVRHASVDALAQLLQKVADALGTTVDKLSVGAGRVSVSGETSL